MFSTVACEWGCEHLALIDDGMETFFCHKIQVSLSLEFADFLLQQS